MRFTFALALLALAGPASAAPAALKIAISAPKGMPQAKAQAALIDAALEEALGRPVEVQVLATGAKAVEALAAGTADLAWLSPVAYLQARATTALLPLATFVRNGSAEQKAVFIARADGPKSLSESSGKRVAWLGETSTSSTFARLLLAAERKKTPAFFLQQSVVPNHLAVCKAVLEGRAELGVTYGFSVATGFDADLPSPDGPAPKADAAPAPSIRIGGCTGVADADKLHVVAESAAFPNDIIAARLKLPAADRKAVSEALLKLGDGDAGRKALVEAFDAEALQAANAAALDALGTLFAAE